VNLVNYVTKIKIFKILAEREGFEPSVPLTVHTLSKRAD
jgi:hypothetical protein